VKDGRKRTTQSVGRLLWPTVMVSEKHGWQRRRTLGGEDPPLHVGFWVRSDSKLGRKETNCETKESDALLEREQLTEKNKERGGRGGRGDMKAKANALVAVARRVAEGAGAEREEGRGISCQSTATAI